MTTHQSTRIVIIDDDILIAGFFEDICRANGGAVVGVGHTPDDAIELAVNLKPDYVLMDLHLDCEQNGIDCSLELATKLPQTRIVFITGSSETGTIEDIQDSNCHAILIKPIRPDDLAEVLGLSQATARSEKFLARA